MEITKALTPKNTEEIRPGLFIQARPKNPNSIVYKQIFPFAWNNKILWKEQLRTVFAFRTLFTIALIIFIAWAYLNNVGVYKQFYDETISNPMEFCKDFSGSLGNGLDGTDGLNIKSLEVINEDTNTL